jgi:hypothetical protein
VVERLPKTALKGAVFCRLFTGTETYAVKHTLAATLLPVLLLLLPVVGLAVEPIRRVTTQTEGSKFLSSRLG